jgi:hypothetical protein
MHSICKKQLYQADPKGKSAIQQIIALTTKMQTCIRIIDLTQFGRNLLKSFLSVCWLISILTKLIHIIFLGARGSAARSQKSYSRYFCKSPKVGIAEKLTGLQADPMPRSEDCYIVEV